MELPQVAAGENPLLRVTDISRGHELTSEWKIKQGVGTRLSIVKQVQILPPASRRGKEVSYGPI
ncbi:MAG TPA: hypothetical protein PK821_05525 [Victivallales bacterium]|nr:hypothetical protein [Victivallales bacterium]